MPFTVPCPYCKNDIQQPAEHCPHCGRPGYFWNVIAAEDSAEREALERRYQRAKKDATSRSADAAVQGFEDAVAGSKAVIARSLSEVLRLATSDRQLYATYYELSEAGISLPIGGTWDTLRQLADTLLFSDSRKHIRFGALSLDGIGLSSYGDCSLVLRDEMIAHRSSVLEENSAMFMERREIKVSREPKLPRGYKATWDDRGKLCVAKLADRIDSTTSSEEHSRILLKQGVKSEEDEFVEVHIYGAITVRTMEHVNVTTRGKRRRAATLRAIKFKLAEYGVGAR